MQLSQLYDFGDTNIFSSTIENNYDSDFIFSSDDGLQFAFGITAYDGNSPFADDPDYGEIVARYQTWGFGSNGAGLSAPIPMRRCEKDDFGLGESGKSMFYPISDRSIWDVETFYPRLWCFDYKAIAKGDSD